MENRSYSWKAIDQEGRIISGRWEVNGPKEVRKKLFSLGYFPLNIRQNKPMFYELVQRIWRLLGRVSQLDQLRNWSLITKRLSVLLQSGIPLVKAIEILDQTTKNKRYKHFNWHQVKEKVESGAEFHEALKVMTYPPSPLVIAIIRAGEYVGRLSEALSDISKDLEQQFLFRRKLSEAYAYPVFLLVLTVLILYVLSVMVLPVYEQVFASLDTDLPFMTQVVFGLLHDCPVFLFGMIGVLATCFGILRFRNPRNWQDILSDWLCKVPILGQVYRLNNWYQFTNLLAILLEAGIPMMEALGLTRGALKGNYMKKLLLQLEHAAREGKRLSPVLRLHRDFPQDAIQMLAVGEESGQLSEMLRLMAKTFHYDLEEQMQRLPRIIGPSLIIFIALMIGGIAVGILIPAFDVGTHIE